LNRKTIFKVLFGILIAGAVVFAGITVYGNFFASKLGEVKMPTAQEAGWALTVKNTTTVIFADKLEQVGYTIGDRTYILNGYWELQGSKFVWKSGQLVMSEKVWGEITLKKR
jgi:hypothetical protein